MEYLLLFVGLIALAISYIKLALRYGIVDHPNYRSSHQKETVRGGGIIFPVSVLSWFIYSGRQYPLFFIGLLIISAVSFWDDLSPVSPKWRLIIHFWVLLLLFTQVELYKMPWWTWIPALILSTWTINAYNFMDGINGITSGYSISVLIGLWIVNNFQVEFISNEMIYFMMVPLIVFSYFNFRTSAKCFAGDVGSISIAYVMVFLLARLIIKTGNWLYLLFLCVYGVDTVLTILHRFMQKEDLFVAHRKHVYQLLVNELKLPHLAIAAVYSFVQLIICLVLITIVDKNDNLSLIAGISITGILIFAFYRTRNQIYKKIKVIGTTMQNQL